MNRYQAARQLLRLATGLSVEVVFPDSIPKQLLRQGDSGSEISGFVHPDKNLKRAGIYLGDQLVGFMTPREDKAGWRVGAIFVLPKHQRQGIASKAIAKFLEGREAAPVPIGVDNVASQKAFSNAGFKLDPNEPEQEDPSDGWKYKIWHSWVNNE